MGNYRQKEQMEDESDMMDQQQEYVEGDMMDDGYGNDMMGDEMEEGD